MLKMIKLFDKLAPILIEVDIDKIVENNDGSLKLILLKSKKT